MAELTIPSDPKEALNTVCFFLAQSGEPHEELGYKTQLAAFEDIGSKFGVPKHTVRNIRDTFDRHTESDRVGWNTELSEPLKYVFDKLDGAQRYELYKLCHEIMKTKWTSMEQNGNPVTDRVDHVADTVRFSQKVAENFKIPAFSILSESYATTWGFVNGRGRAFKLSNDDLRKTLEEILSAWDIWVSLRLNVNNRNPDETLTQFAARHFSKGAHQVLANDQRRGFLHFISAVAYTATHDSLFDEGPSSNPLDKEDYEAALELVTEIQKNSIRVSQISEVAEDDATYSRKALTGGENAIFYGAPGTGKSKLVDDKIAGSKSFRTVFHPDLQNSDFFGCLKPQMLEGNVRYGFAPGPFMQALAAAYISPDEAVYLVVEELNRAAAAAVFGDLFLLLDRDYDGAGEYDVSFPSPESRDWFENETSGSYKSLRLPSNLFIYATMNSADHGVYPIDTAFRRRWRQEYLPLDYNSGPEGNVSYVDSTGKPHRLAWREYVRLLNEHLTGNHILNIAEDRLLGPWFVKAKELHGRGIPEKVLLYLWDDLLRHEGRDHVFDTKVIKTYGALAAKAKDNLRFLSDSFLEVLNAASVIASEVVADNDED